MTEMPYGWDARRLKDTGTWRSGGTPLTTEPSFWGGGIPWISSGSLKSWKLRESDRTLTEEGVRAGSRLVPAGTVLMVVRGMSLKTEFRLGIAGRPLAFGQDCKALEPAPDFDGTYLAYAIKSRTSEILDLVDEAGHGTGRLSSDRLLDVRIPVPDLNEQRAIAAILGALDDKIDSNRRIVERADDLADLLFAETSTNRERASIYELARTGALAFSDGYRTRTDQLGSPGLPILRVADMVDGHIEVPTGDSVLNEYLVGNEAKCSIPGDVVVSTKGTVGRVVLISNDQPRFVYSPQICFMRALDLSMVTPSLLYRWARSSSFKSQAAAVQGQTDMAAYINLSDFGRMTLPIRGSHTPDAVAIEALDQMIAQLRREAHALEATRDTLLPGLMTGEIRVPDARRHGEFVV